MLKCLNFKIGCIHMHIFTKLRLVQSGEVELLVCSFHIIFPIHNCIQNLMLFMPYKICWFVICHSLWNRIICSNLILGPCSYSWLLNLTCRCYLKLYDTPLKSTSEEDDEMSKLPSSQKKKLRQKQRKAEARAKKVLYFLCVACGCHCCLPHRNAQHSFQEAEGKNEESNAGGVSKSGKRHVKPVDPDPHGEKLLQVIFVPQLLLTPKLLVSNCYAGIFKFHYILLLHSKWRYSPSYIRTYLLRLRIRC